MEILVTTNNKVCIKQIDVLHNVKVYDRVSNALEIVELFSNIPYKVIEDKNAINIHSSFFLFSIKKEDIFFDEMRRKNIIEVINRIKKVININ